MFVVASSSLRARQGADGFDDAGSARPSRRHGAAPQGSPRNDRKAAGDPDSGPVRSFVVQSRIGFPFPEPKTDKSLISNIDVIRDPGGAGAVRACRRIVFPGCLAP